MKFQASLKNYRCSASKVRRVTPLIKGLEVSLAEEQLKYSNLGSAQDVSKLLQSAIANAKNTYNVEENSLWVNNLVAQEGRTLKRWRARAYGRAAQIRKRTCHIVITLESKDKQDDKNKEDKKDNQKKVNKVKNDQSKIGKSKAQEKQKGVDSN